MPIKGTEPAVRVEKVGAAENVVAAEKVFAPARVCAPVFTRPLAVAEASGILNVCVLPEEAILKSVPVVAVANVWVAAVNPFKLVIAPPDAVKVDIGSFLTTPLVIVRRLSALVLVPVCTPTRVTGLVPTTCKALDGEVVPMPRNPAEVSRMISVPDDIILAEV